MKFTESTHCAKRNLCFLCRDTGPQGDQFRENMATVYEIPKHFFPCPYGITEVTVARPILTEKKQWPLIVRAIAKLQKDEDTGVGDTIARTLEASFDTESLKKWKMMITGAESCGCAEDQAVLNSLYPYPRKDHA